MPLFSCVRALEPHPSSPVFSPTPTPPYSLKSKGGVCCCSGAKGWAGESRGLALRCYARSLQRRASGRCSKRSPAALCPAQAAYTTQSRQVRGVPGLPTSSWKAGLLFQGSKINALLSYSQPHLLVESSTNTGTHVHSSTEQMRDILVPGRDVGLVLSQRWDLPFCPSTSLGALCKTDLLPPKARSRGSALPHQEVQGPSSGLAQTSVTTESFNSCL